MSLPDLKEINDNLSAIHMALNDTKLALSYQGTRAEANAIIDSHIKLMLIGSNGLISFVFGNSEYEKTFRDAVAKLNRAIADISDSSIGDLPRKIDDGFVAIAMIYHYILAHYLLESLTQ